jgi:hypothetical protein
MQLEYLPCYYFRLEISNTGNLSAHDVEVFAASLRRKRADGTFENVSRFTPMNLLWAHEHKVYLPLLAPKMTKFCDLGHIIFPKDRPRVGHDLSGISPEKCIMAFDLQVEPNMKGHLIDPGTYSLALLVAAENCRPREYTVDISFSGDWYDSEQDMFRDGIGLHVA